MAITNCGNLKKNGKLWICIDFQKLNATTKNDPYQLCFTDEVLDKVVGHEVYLFLDGFFYYHQIQIAPRDYYKTTFIMDLATIVWVLMPFGLQNALAINQKAMNKAFKDYVVDFMVFSDLDTHLSKLWKCFEKCWEYGISFNPKKCVFMVFLGMILRLIIFEEEKLLDLKNVKMIVKMPMPKNPHDIQIFNGLGRFYWCFVKKIAFIMALITKFM